MIRVRLDVELEEDEYGPREKYVERLVLPPWFAQDAAEAHAKLLTLLVTERYFELPQAAGAEIPLNSTTVRSLVVWNDPRRT